MTLAELRYVVALAREQNFGRAAHDCCVSQPALSAGIKKLEKELDVVLFERIRAGVQPTAMGERIIAQAQRVLASTAELHEIVQAGRDPVGGSLSLGAIFSAGPYLLPQCIAYLKRVARGLRFRVEEGYTADLAENLQQGKVDAIVVSLPFSAPDVVTQTLFEEPFVVVMPHNHPLSKTPSIASVDISPHELLLPGKDQCLREQILAACPHIDPDNSLGHGTTGTTLETLRNMVGYGMGITVMPLSAATQLSSTSRSVISRPFCHPVPTRTLALAWRASFPRHHLIDLLRDAMCIASGTYYATDHESVEPGLVVDNSHW